MRRIPVSEVMTRYPISVSPDTNLLKCAKLMIKKRVGSLLLVHKKRLVGFITQQDIIWALVKKSRKDLSMISAIDISRKKIGVIKPSASLEEAIGKMKKLKFERLPVVSKGNVVGMITIKDIITFNPEIYPELSELDYVREESAKLKRLGKIKKVIGNGVDGNCEECGNFDSLRSVDGRMICESCLSAM
jgi:CBS domain-containing protein